jgi:hypothetical protein
MIVTMFVLHIVSQDGIQVNSIILRTEKNQLVVGCSLLPRVSLTTLDVFHNLMVCPMWLLIHKVVLLLQNYLKKRFNAQMHKLKEVEKQLRKPARISSVYNSLIESSYSDEYHVSNKGKLHSYFAF